VVTINIHRRRLLKEKLEEVQTKVHSKSGRERSSPFFVQNLENVEGDERDVIFFTSFRRIWLGGSRLHPEQRG